MWKIAKAHRSTFTSVVIVLLLLGLATMAAIWYMQIRFTSKLQELISGTIEPSDPTELQRFHSVLANVQAWGATDQGVATIIEMLRTPDQRVRSNATCALHILDYRANQSILDSLGDPEIGGYMAVELAKRKADVFPQLADMLLHSGDANKRRAAVAVFNLSSRSADLTESEQQLLRSALVNDSSVDVRVVCANTLGYCLQPSDVTVRALINAANAAPEGEVVLAAVRSLAVLDRSQFGRVTERLLRMISSTNVQERIDGVNAMSLFGRQVNTIMPELRRAMAEESDERVKSTLERLTEGIR